MLLSCMGLKPPTRLKTNKIRDAFLFKAYQKDGKQIITYPYSCVDGLECWWTVVTQTFAGFGDKKVWAAYFPTIWYNPTTNMVS